MILKTFNSSHVLLKIKKQNICLFYGENLGMMDEFKKDLILENKDAKIIKVEQDEILKNINNFFNEILNMSLFEKKKSFFIYHADDKILSFIEEIEPSLDQNKIYLFSGILNKNSKLRSYFEKSKKYSALPCYQDDDLTIKRIISSKLKDYQGLNNENINIIAMSCNKDRMKLNNEINKIVNCFLDKKIETVKLENLLNTNINEDLNELRDAILEGNKVKTNKMLSETIMQDEKNILYLQMINQRINKISEIINLSLDTSIDQAVSSIKPPIFWKDKKNITLQAKKLNKVKIRKINEKTYDIELKVKSNSLVNQGILMKKLFIDICNLTNS